MAAARVVAVLLLTATLALGPVAAQDERPRRIVNVSLQDQGCPQGPDRFCTDPSTVELEEGTDLVLRVRNEGRILHNLTFTGEASSELRRHGMNGTLAANETRRLHVPWDALSSSLEEAGRANATMVCGRDGHAALGERLRIHVPSLAGAGERPQPGPGAAGALAAIALVALAYRRSR